MVEIKFPINPTVRRLYFREFSPIQRTQRALKEVHQGQEVCLSNEAKPIPQNKISRGKKTF